MNGTRNLTKWTAVIACSAMLGALAVFAVLAAASRRSGQSTQSIDPTEDVATRKVLLSYAEQGIAFAANAEEEDRLLWKLLVPYARRDKDAGKPWSGSYTFRGNEEDEMHNWPILVSVPEATMVVGWEFIWPVSPQNFDRAIMPKIIYYVQDGDALVRIHSMWGFIGLAEQYVGGEWKRIHIKPEEWDKLRQSARERLLEVYGPPSPYTPTPVFPPPEFAPSD